MSYIYITSFQILIFPILINIINGNKTQDFQIKTLKFLKYMLEEKNELLLKKLNEEASFNKFFKATYNETTTIVAAVQNKIPYIWLEVDEKKEITTKGYVGQIWTLLQTILKFDVRYLNGSGITALRDGLVDIYLTPVTMASQHFDHFDCTHSLGKIWNFLYGKSSSQSLLFSTVWNLHSKWSIVTYILFILSGALQWLLLNLRAHFGLDIQCDQDPQYYIKKVTNSQDSKSVYDMSLINSYFNVYGLILSQGSQFKPTSNSSRILSLTCMTFGMLLMTSYSAILISKIATRSSNLRYGSLYQIYTTHQFSLCVSENSFAYNNFKIPGSQQLKKKWEPIVNRFPCTAKGKESVPIEDYCNPSNMVLENPHNLNFLRKNIPSMPCQFNYDQKKYFINHLSLSFRKGSPYREFINRYLIRIKSSGTLSYLLKKLDEFTETDKKVLVHAVSFHQIKGVATLYLEIMGLSLVIFFVEIIVYNLNNIIFKVKEIFKRIKCH